MLLQQQLGAFVWSKMGTESGEDLEAILRRKEVERQANGEKFVWGIGNSPGDSIASFMQVARRHMAVFTPMKSNPKERDVSPPRVVIWRAYKNRQGIEQPLPPYSFVTSRAGKKHYALLCECDEELRTQHHGKLNSGGLVNYKSDKQMGGSQVTAVVKDSGGKGVGDYSIRFAASLYDEGWVTLTDYADISKQQIEEVTRSADDEDVEKWKELIDKIKGG